MYTWLYVLNRKQDSFSEGKVRSGKTKLAMDKHVSVNALTVRTTEETPHLFTGQKKVTHCFSCMRALLLTYN